MLDICVEGQNRGIVVTPLLKPQEVLSDPHLRARGTFIDTEVGESLGGSIASGFFELDNVRHGFDRRSRIG